MVGTHTFIGKHSKIELEQLNFLKHEPWFCIKHLEALAHISMFISYYHGYPYTVLKDDSWTLIMEGMIYFYRVGKDELANKLIYILKNIQIERSKTKQNEKYIYDYCLWENRIRDWINVYNSDRYY